MPTAQQLPTEALGFAALLDTAPQAGFWTWLRACDRQGSGVALVVVEDAATALGKTRQTIRNWLRRGLAQRWFRSVTQLERGVYRVYLSSLFRVATEVLGLENLGPAAIVPCDRLCDPKRLATDIAAEELQAAARRARIRELTKRDGNDPRGPKAKRKKGKKRKGQQQQCVDVPTAYDLLHSTRKPISSESSPGGKDGASPVRVEYTVPGTHGSGDRCLFTTPEANAVGSSQVLIAEVLGRSLSTIRRRLSLAIRDRLGRPAILKKQIVVKVETGDQSAAQYKSWLMHESRDLKDPELLYEAKRHFCAGALLWRFETNIYYAEGLQPKRLKRRRAAFKKFVENWGAPGLCAFSQPLCPSRDSRLSPAR